MKHKLTKLCNRFCKESCKVTENSHNENLINDQIIKARIIEAEAHKELLDENLQCSPDKCWECSNVLC